MKINVYYSDEFTCWVAYYTDSNGNQIGNCEYASIKRLVLHYLKQSMADLEEDNV